MDVDLTSEFDELYAQLRHDVDLICPHRLSEDGASFVYADPVSLSQPQRRAFVRATFALVEGVGFFMRQLLVKHFGSELSVVEVLALQERQVDVGVTGRAQTKVLRTGALALVKLTFSLYERIFPVAADVSSGSAFDDLSRSTSVRDRLMHPKSSGHLVVTDDEVRQVLRAFAWFNDAVRDLLEAYVQEFERRVRELR